MKKSVQNNWLCLYVFIKPPFEKFLVECLLPITIELKSHGIVRKFFFIRYGEGGAHIRYRLFIEKDENIAIVYKDTSEQIQKYLLEKNIESSSADGLYIRLNKYEPEYERYLGVKGVEIAESIFEQSSITILKLLNQLPFRYNYNNSFLLASVLNYTMLCSFVSEHNVVKEILLFNYRRWLPKSNPQKYSMLSATQYIMDQETIFKSKFLFAREKFVPYIKDYEQQVKSKRFKNLIIGNWANKMEEFGDDVTKLIQHNGNLKEENNKFQKIALYSLYDSYIHMNNNRLGIRNADESFLAYILYHAVNEIERYER